MEWGFVLFWAIVLTVIALLIRHGLQHDRAVAHRSQARRAKLIQVLAAAAGTSTRIGNNLFLDDNHLLLAVDTDASALFMALVHDDGSVLRKRLSSHEITSVEQVSRITTTSVSFGDVLPVGGMAPLVMAGTTNSRITGVWLKILTRNVSAPWIIIPMPDMATADDWRGIIMMMLDRPGSRGPTPQAFDPTAPDNLKPTITAPARQKVVFDDRLLPLPSELSDSNRAA